MTALHDLLVSIHAPVKGAIPEVEKTVDDIEVSIHAPVKGAMSKGMLFNAMFRFQSTHP